MIWESGTFWLSALLALSVPIVLVGGLWNRQAGEKPKGIGWQFIRYTVLAISIPIVALLALNHVLSAEVATLIGTAMGFAFGKKDD
jgi:hypothetical protein